jgi:hypothetical protein
LINFNTLFLYNKIIKKRTKSLSKKGFVKIVVNIRSNMRLNSMFIVLKKNLSIKKKNLFKKILEIYSLLGSSTLVLFNKQQETEKHLVDNFQYLKFRLRWKKYQKKRFFFFVFSQDFLYFLVIAKYWEYFLLLVFFIFILRSQINFFFYKPYPLTDFHYRNDFARNKVIYWR